MDKTMTHRGRVFHVKHEPDDDHDAPWDSEDGHGPVSDLVRRSKRPGELVLSQYRGECRYYDYAEAVKIARRDRWGWIPAPLKLEFNVPGDARKGGWARSGPYARYDDDLNHAIGQLYAQVRVALGDGEIAARAARADYERLRQWCNDVWWYIGVVVSPLCPCCGQPNQMKAASLWGIESDAGDYLDEVARQLADEILGDEEKAA